MSESNKYNFILPTLICHTFKYILLAGNFTYVIKLRDLKEQSQGCLRILFRMKEEAPYFAHTLKTVYSHTKTVSQLLED